MPDRLTGILALVCAILLGLLGWTYTQKGAAELKAAEADRSGAEHAENARTRAAELRGALEAVSTLETALEDSAAAWSARLAVSDATLAESVERAADVNAELSARLDSVGKVLLDSLNAEHAAQLDAKDEQIAVAVARAGAQQERADSLASALFTSMAESDDWEASAESYRVASETKDAVIRSLKLQRNAGVVTTLAGVTAVVVLVSR